MSREDKRSEINRPRTSIENLDSNELFYEISDYYLDGVYLYQAFSNLSQHFQRLIKTPFVLFKIKSYKTSRKAQFVHHWKHMIELHRHQILSIQIEESAYDEEFFTSAFLLNPSFNHLQSFNIRSCNHLTLISILTKLSSLPSLSSLIISSEASSTNLTDIYRLVFN